jgi:hypothetical protein
VRAAVVVPLVLGAVLVAATASATPARRSAVGCSTNYLGLKTLSDPQRKLVNLHPKDTTVSAITQLVPPQPTPTTRTPFERRVWRVTASITLFRRESDSDIHLILFGESAYMVAEMPAATCLPKKTRDRKAIINARKRFVAACGQPTDSWKPLGAVVRISGVGFWDRSHKQIGNAPNHAKLHPVTGFKVLTGCGA